MSFLCGAVHFDGAPVEARALRCLAGAAGLEAPTVATWVAGDAGLAVASPPGLEGSPLLLSGSESRLVVAADLRLDNRAELSASLSRPPGSPASDADLLLAAYETWGSEGCVRVGGAWAAAVWDAGRRRLFLARDALGERALYWCRRGERLYFASEPACLSAIEGFSPQPDRRRLLAHLLGARPEPHWTFFEGINRLPEGHWLSAGQEGTRLERYWDLDVPCPARSDADAAAELAACLSAAVARRLSVAGETGVLLSGGLDSCAVAAEAAGELERVGRRLYAFTWASRSGDGIDERAFSSLFVGSRANVVEHAVEADDLGPLARYPEAYADCNDPGANTYPDLLLATLETARRQGVRALLNGIGGDAVIGWTVPDLALLASGRWLALRSRAGVRGVARSLLSAVGLQRRLALPAWLTPEARRMARESDLDRPPVTRRDQSSAYRFRRFALASHGNAASLERFDRLSRRTGVRISAPWHDADLARLALSLPDCALAVEQPGKRLLRAAMAGKLPEAITTAPTAKQERSSLRARGLFEDGRGTVEALLGGSRLGEMGLIQGRQALNEYRTTAASHGKMPRLWEVITAEAWLLLIEQRNSR